MTPRIAILADHLEEGWTSMDHYAAMLVEHLRQDGDLQSVLVRPPFHHRLGRARWIFGPRHGRTLDLYLNRYIEYPRAAARTTGFDLFHIVDQTYAHVATRLPLRRTVVTCHDLDFADPPPGTRQAWLVRMTGAVALRGIRAAARVICDSEVIRQEILRRGLVEPDRLSVVPLGVEDVFAPDGPADLPREAEARLVRVGAGPVILHVGGMVTRKRLDLVMRAVAFARRELPGAVLVRVGGPLSSAMRTLARQLGIEMAIVEMPFLTRPELAAMYRRADVLLLCSETEGFGLPVLEAMASGLSVVARNLPAVREVAGEAVQFVDGQDPQAFAAAVVAVLRDAPVREAMRRRGLERAAMFRWGRTVERTARVYQDVLRQTSEAAGR